MTRIALLAALLCLLAQPASAQFNVSSVWADMPIASYHVGDNVRDASLNELNPGLGLLICNYWCVGAGAYRNSQGGPAAYTLVGREWPTFGRLSAGVDMGIALGYGGWKALPFTPIVAPTVSVKLADRWRLKAMALPISKPVVGFRVLYLIGAD